MDEERNHWETEMRIAATVTRINQGYLVAAAIQAGEVLRPRYAATPQMAGDLIAELLMSQEEAAAKIRRTAEGADADA